MEAEGCSDSAAVGEGAGAWEGACLGKEIRQRCIFYVSTYILLSEHCTIIILVSGASQYCGTYCFMMQV